MPLFEGVQAPAAKGSGAHRLAVWCRSLRTTQRVQPTDRGAGPGSPTRRLTHRTHHHCYRPLTRCCLPVSFHPRDSLDDEQHQFGVTQAPIERAHTAPDVLVMTATPDRGSNDDIYGDLDVSPIEEIASERGKSLGCADGSKLGEVLAFLRTRWRRSPVYVIYPLMMKVKSSMSKPPQRVRLWRARCVRPRDGFTVEFRRRRNKDHGTFRRGDTNTLIQHHRD